MEIGTDERAIERLNEEFRRRIETQTVLLWALLASGQITMRKVDGWETVSQPVEPFAPHQAP